MLDFVKPRWSEHRPVTPHSILSSKLAALRASMTEGGASSLWLEALDECCALALPLDAYIADHSTAPSEALDGLEAHTNALDWQAAYEAGQTKICLEKEMVSGAVEGQFLKLLTALSKAHRVLEIGSFTGYASLAMAEALPEDGLLVACEYDAFAAQVARTQLDESPHGHKIDIRIGAAQPTLQTLKEADATFDLVFIDADKTGYLEYYQTVLDADLLPVGGLIAVDNTLYMGQVYAAESTTSNGAALQTFNAFVRDDARVEQVLLPLRDGLTLIRRIA